MLYLYLIKISNLSRLIKSSRSKNRFFRLWLYSQYKRKKYRALINKYLNINFVEKKDSVEMLNKKLPLDIKFYPLRPFKTDIAFKLQNVFTKDAKFIAYFSHDSTSEFSVTPREGTLDQSGRDGSQFVICYLPVEYGKIKIGKLTIETDEVQWIFEVRGTHLDYKPPEVKKTNILKMTKASENRLINEKIKEDNKKNVASRKK